MLLFTIIIIINNNYYDHNDSLAMGVSLITELVLMTVISWELLLFSELVSLLSSTLSATITLKIAYQE